MEVEEQPSLTEKMMRSCQILERMVTQNSCTEIAEDFKFYEDPADEFKVAWSTLIGLGSTLLRSHWSRASLVLLAPAILCHKEPARASKAPFWGYFACSSLVLYVIRIVGFLARKGPIIGALMP